MRDQGEDASGEWKEEDKNRGWELVWDRKIEGGFPEMKVLVSHDRSL